MKTLITTLIAIALLVVTLTGCKKEEDKEKSNIPTFEFKKSAGYTSITDATAPAGGMVMLGFNAIKPENGDELKGIEGTLTIDNTTTPVVSHTFDLSLDRDVYSNTFSIAAPNGVGQLYTYTFTLRTTGTGTKTLKMNVRGR